MLINIRVKPNSSEQSVEKSGEFYLVKLKSPAQEGKANLELVKLLSKYFGKEVKIKSGFNSRNKIIEIKD
jgi:uncharacterized protein (TIGR00251 family)